MDDNAAHTVYCPTCYSTKFKPSRPRNGDWLRLLLFKRPVRCTKCGLRMYAGLGYVRLLRKQQDQNASVHA